MTTTFENFLNKFNEQQWLGVLTSVLPEIHEVDRNAAQIWFRFYPLELFRYLQTAENKEKAIQQFVMQGEYELKNQIDSSHRFLYGHRFWKETKDAINKHAENFEGANADLAHEIRRIAKAAAVAAKTDANLTVGITMVGLMTLVQVGFDAFKQSAGTVSIDAKTKNQSPQKIVEERAKDDSQGIFGFLKTIDKQWTVNYIDDTDSGKFRLMNDEEIASGAARDQSKNWVERDFRRGEGVIPVECRSAACGTCWVGVLGGAEKLSDVAPRERKQMKIFGYQQGEEAKPLMRLACQAKANGAVSIVIPPWNGVFGKKIYGGIADVTLEPATTSAAKLREAISTAMTDE
ncbi:MAG: (2Fe-2S)-binding protein [Pyrinomonadaceae bacterium]|nr:(2Fe-2S)-binding protein [Pyrinomonadaceae bacterium]